MANDTAPTVWACLSYRDAPAGIDFLKKAFGFEEKLVVTDEPDALCERATAAGATLVRPLRDEDYGSRGFTVSDPEGNLWSFGTYRGE